MITDRLQEPNSHKPEPKIIYEADSFIEPIYDQDGKEFSATISFEGYHYDEALRIVKLIVSTALRHVEEEDVVNLLELREGKRIKLETKMQIV